MAIGKGYKANSKTLLKAAGNSDLCLMECLEKATNKKAVLVCAAYKDDGEVCFVPLARMIDGNPYEEFLPPSPGDRDQFIAENGDKVRAKR